MRKYVRNGAIASMAVGNNASAFVTNPLHQLISSRSLRRSHSDTFARSPKASIAASGRHYMSERVKTTPLDMSSLSLDDLTSEGNEIKKQVPRLTSKQVRRVIASPQLIKVIRKFQAEQTVKHHLKDDIDVISHASSDSSDAKDQDPNPRVSIRTEQKRKAYYGRHLKALAKTGLPASPAFIDLAQKARDSRLQDCRNTSLMHVTYSDKTQGLYRSLGHVLRDNTVLHNALLRKALRSAIKSGNISIDDLKKGGVATYKNKQKHIRKHLQSVIAEYISKLGITYHDFPDKDIGLIVMESLAKNTMSGHSDRDWIAKAMREGGILNGNEVMGTQFHHIVPKAQSPSVAMAPSALAALGGTEPGQGHRPGQHDIAHQAFGFRKDDDLHMRHLAGYSSSGSEKSHYGMHDYQAINIALEPIMRRRVTKREAYNLDVFERLKEYHLYYTHDKKNPAIAAKLDKIYVESHKMKRIKKPDHIVKSYVYHQLRGFPEGRDIIFWQRKADKTVKMAR